MDDQGLNDAAIMLMSLGEEEAAEVFKHFSPKEVQKLGETIARMRTVSREKVDEVINKFSNAAAAQSLLVSDTGNYVRAVLKRALGEDKAGLLIDRILQGGDVSGIESLKWMDPLSVAELLRNEHPQIVAAILVHLDAEQASAILMQLTDRAGAMMAPEAAKKPDFAAHPVCSGPYKFDSRVSQDRIVLTRFDNYWNKDAYHFDKIIYLPIPDASVRLANLRAGDLDLTEGIAASDVKTVEADSKLALAKVTGLGYQGITFNINNGKVPANDPFKDARVREAFSQAIDRDALNQVVFEGLYSPANQAFSTVSPYHVNLPVPPRDVDKAKALLKAAGVTAPLTVNLLVPNNPTSQQVGQVLQAMVAEAGFNLNLQMTEFATLLDRQQSGDYQLSFSGWSGRPDPDGSIYGFINSKGTLNDGRYSNAQVDEWLTQARQSTDQAARQPLYDKVVKQLQTDMPIAYLYFEPRIFGLNKSVQGFKPYPDGIVRLAGLTLAK